MVLDVVAIGNANVDIVMYVDRIPREDEALEAYDSVISAGGSASNYAVALARLGIRCGFIGRVGDDSFGEFVKREFEKEGVDISRLKVDREHPTGKVFIIVTKNGARRMIAHRGANAYITLDESDEEYISRAKLVHAASIRRKLALEIAKVSSKYKITFSYDPGLVVCKYGLEELKPIFSHVKILYLNLRELECLTGSKDPESASKLLQYGPKLVIVKMGSKGSYLVLSEARIRVPPYKPKKVVDTTGAGDVFAAALTAGLLKGLSLWDSALFASVAAGLKVERKGARNGIPYEREVLSIFKEVKSKLEKELIT